MKYLTFIAIVFFAMTMPLASQEIKTVHVMLAADSENAGYEAWRAMDGDPGTMWHTQFSSPSNGGHVEAHPIRCGYSYACGYDHHWQSVAVDKKQESNDRWGTSKPGNNTPCPHELRVDLGDVYKIKGFVYTPRKGRENGTIRDYEFIVDKGGETALAETVLRGTFEGEEMSYRVLLSEPVSCRYIKLVAISEIRKAPFASVAEIELISDGVRFVAAKQGLADARHVPRMPDTPDDPAMQERVDEWNLIVERFKTRQYWKAIENEVYDKASLILPEDHDPVDVVLHRLKALLDDWHLTEEQSMYPVFLEKVRKTSLKDVQARFALFVAISNYRRNLMLRSPQSPLNGQKIGVSELLFVKRHRSTFQHMCDQFYGRTQRPGGGLFVLDVATGKVRNLLENSIVENGRLKGQKLEGGSFLSPDVSFDGEKIAFAYVECQGPSNHDFHYDPSRGKWDIGRSYHIFTCNRDGGALRQITDGTWNDFDPCWMPSGRICFISERRNGYLRCGRECPTYTLFDMNPDGTKMRCLSYHETNEWNPSVAHDGKILYTRWDYVDRYGCIVHHPWLTTPDGRDPRQVHGNYSHRHRRADAEFDCRAIPASPKYIATGGPHHGQSFGSLIIVDPQVEDDDAMGPVKRITPDVGFPESQGGGEVYGTPWPLDEKNFLCVADFSFQPGASIPGKGSRGNDGIYLCDVYGNRELLYRDPDIACISPMPLASRSAPPVVTEIVRHEDIEEQTYVGLRETSPGNSGRYGTMSLVNVYDSLRPFPKDAEIKELRIIQLLPMTTPSHSIRNTRTGIQEASSLDSVNIARAVLGTVPVEEDGSAHFRLPAQIEFQFQALDAQGRAVQSMRSSSYLQPGENLSCNGCHEPKTTAPKRVNVIPKAMRREASEIKPETAPGARPFSYPLLVQPILDKHCVECHARPESETFSLAKEPIRERFYESYNNLAPKYGFTNYGDPLRTTPGKFGALASPLYILLEKGHYDVKLSDDEMHRIVLWLDCISNFYGVYETEGQKSQLHGEVVWPTLE